MSMIDVIELIVNDSHGNQVFFDFKCMRIANNKPVRVCYKYPSKINLTFYLSFLPF